MRTDMKNMKNEGGAPAENKMGVMPIEKLLLSMSLPMMISMLVQALYNIVDSIFVSRINEYALRAVRGHGGGHQCFLVQNLGGEGL